MTTETDLRVALRSRAADAPAVDPERMLAELTHRDPPVRSAAGVSHGRRWAIAGVAAGFVALAVTSGVVLAGGEHRAAPGGAAAPPATAPPAVTSAPPSLADTVPPPGTPVSSPPASEVNPDDPAAPVPLDASWADTRDDQSVDVDPAAIVFSQDPIVAFYVRAHEQLSILPGGGTAKDSHDAPWHTAVHVYLAGSGFDPASIGDPSPVTVDGVARQFGTLPKLLDVPGPAAVPSLLWQVGDAWVALQISTPAVPTAAQLVAAAGRLDVHPG